MKRPIAICAIFLLTPIWNQVPAKKLTGKFVEAKNNFSGPHQMSDEPSIPSISLLVPTATLTRQPPMGAVCQGNSANFRLTITGGPSPWTVEIDSAGATIVISGITSSPHNFSKVQGNAGNIGYFVKKVTDNNSAVNTTIGSTVTVVVNPRPVANAGNNLTLCNYTSLFPISGTISNATGGSWSTTGTGSFSPSATSLNTNYIPSTADKNSGTISLILSTTGNGGCTAGRDTITATFIPDPFLNSNAVISDSVACVNTTITLGVTGLPVGSITSFDQILPSSSSLGGGLNVLSQPVLLNSSGSYLFTVSMTQSGNNCQKNAILEATANVCAGFDLSYDMISETIYPNPSPGTLRIKLTGREQRGIILELFSDDGKTLERKHIGAVGQGQEELWDIHHLNNGIYFLKVTSDTQTRIHKVIKQ